MAREFQGKDRRILFSLHEAMVAIRIRDNKALDPAPTQAISTLQVCFPQTPNGPGTLDQAFNDVIDRVEALLAMNR